MYNREKGGVRVEPTKKKTFLLRLLTGAFIGLAAIAPGISGGAITIIFGLYEPITDAVAHIWVDFRRKAAFLLPLGLGAAAGMVAFGKLIHYLFLNHSDAMCALFLGLIIGTLPEVFQTASKTGFRRRYLLATAVCGVLVAWIGTVDTLKYTGSATALPYWLAIVSGAIVGIGTVLPGLSASFVLMGMGVYTPMLQALDGFDVPRLLCIGVGFAGAVLLFTRLMSWLFRRFHGWMSFAVAGMLVGSLCNVIPHYTPDWRGAGLVLLQLAGTVLSYGLVRFYQKHTARKSA